MALLFDEVKRLVSMADLVGNKKRIQCPVPSHEDKKPSCDVDHVKNLWHCKGCDKGGSVIDYVMVKDNLDKGQAIKQLADKAGIDLKKYNRVETPEQIEKRDQAARIQEALTFAVNYYHNVLLSHEAGKNYWRNRGIGQQTIERFKMGWSDGQLLTAAAASGFTAEILELAGLATKDDRGLHQDWFDIRLIIPMFDSRGQVANITGRKTDFSRLSSKYIHLKGSKLEGIFNPSGLNSKEIWLFEGHPDTITAAQMGLPAVGVVGTSGLVDAKPVAMTEAVYIVPDNDEPGRRAADRWAEKILHVNPACHVYLVQLPPEINDFNDWYLAHTVDTKNAMDELKASAVGLVEYKISLLKNSDDLGSIWPLLGSPSMTELKREAYFNQIRKRLPGVGVTVLRNDFKNWKANTQNPNKTRQMTADNVIFEEQALLNANIDFLIESDGSAMGLVTLHAKTNIEDENGQTVQVEEPVSIFAKQAPGELLPEFYLSSPVGVYPSSIPEKIAVQGRWSSRSIKQLLDGGGSPALENQLVDRIATLFKTYIWYENTVNYEVLAYFVMSTYAARLFNVVPYLSITGVKGSGKSNTLELLNLLCFNSQKAINSSLAATFRLIESSFITWIRDEAEQFNQITDENRDELCILNDGYKKGGKVNRVEKNAAGQMSIRSYHIYSPKIFGGINLLNATLQDRSISIDAFRAPAEVIKDMPNMMQSLRKIEAEAAAIRDELYTWVMCRFKPVYDEFVNYPSVFDVHNRDWELYLPLFTIAALADTAAGHDVDTPSTYTNRLFEFMRDSLEVKKHSEQDDSIDIRTLEAIYAGIQTLELLPVSSLHLDYYSTSEIATYVEKELKKEGVIFTNWSMTPKKVVRILKQYSIIGKNIEDSKGIKINHKLIRCVKLVAEMFPEAIKN